MALAGSVYLTRVVDTVATDKLSYSGGVLPEGVGACGKPKPAVTTRALSLL